MTIEQFNKTRWCAGMKVHCKPMNMDYEAEVHTVNSVNFDQALIATNNHKYEMETNQWWRCENCEIINPEKEER